MVAVVPAAVAVVAVHVCCCYCCCCVAVAVPVAVGVVRNAIETLLAGKVKAFPYSIYPAQLPDLMG